MLLKDESSKGFTQDFSRNMSLLCDKDKFTRRRSLKNLTADYSKQDLTENSDKIKFLKEVSPTLNDENEMNRGLSIELLLLFINENLLDEEMLMFILPKLLKSFISESFYESSEELRLSMLTIVDCIVERNPKSSLLIEGIIKILIQSLLDKFHEMKKKSFAIISKIAEIHPEPFRSNANPLVKPILNNIVHQHSKVRIECIKCLKIFILNTESKNITETFLPLTQRLFDDNPSVRKAVIECVGEWLLNFIDRYSFHHQMLPIFLSGLHDDFDDIVEYSQDLWVEIGNKYEMENQEKLKDKIDFDQIPDIYPISKELRPNFGCRELIARNAFRIIPSLVNDISDWLFTNRQKASFLLSEMILHLEEENIQYSKTILDGIIKGLTDSLILVRDQEDVYEFFIYTEITQVFGEKRKEYKDFIQILNNKAQEGIEIIVELLRAAYYFGHMVDIKNWWPIIKVSLEQCHESTSTNCLSANLWCLHMLLKATHPPTLSNGRWIEIFKDLTSVLSHDDMISLKSYQNKVPLMKACCSLGLVYPKTRGSDLFTPETRDFLAMSLFTVYVGVCSVNHEKSVISKDGEPGDTLKSPLLGLIEKQAKKEIFSVIAILEEKTMDDDEVNRQFSKYLPVILNRIESSIIPYGEDKTTNSWHCNSTGLHMISFVLTNSSQTSINENLERALKLLIRGCRLQPFDGKLGSSCFLPTSEGVQTSCNPISLAAEAELRLKGLKVLIKMTELPVVRQSMSNLKMLDFILNYAIFPTCVWRAGRVAESMRLVAVTSLLAIIGSSCENLPNKDDYLKREMSFLDGVHVEEWIQKKLPDYRKAFDSLNKIPRLDNISKYSSLMQGDGVEKLSLINLPLVTLKQMFKTLSALIEDDLEMTRFTSLKAIGLVFISFLTEGENLMRIPNWFMNPTIELTKDYKGNPKNQILPQSLADDIMKFYPIILKRLDDIKEPVRQLASDVLIYWMMLVRLHMTIDGYDICVNGYSGDSSIPLKGISITYQPIFQDFLEKVSIYLDDQEETQRISVTRIILYAMHRMHPNGCEKILTVSNDKFRCKEIVTKMLENLSI